MSTSEWVLKNISRTFSIWWTQMLFFDFKYNNELFQIYFVYRMFYTHWKQLQLSLNIHGLAMITKKIFLAFSIIFISYIRIFRFDIVRFKLVFDWCSSCRLPVHSTSSSTLYFSTRLLEARIASRWTWCEICRERSGMDHSVYMARACGLSVGIPWFLGCFHR